MSLIQHVAQVLQVSFTFGLLGLELSQQFFVHLRCSISLLIDPGSFFDEDFQLFFQMVEFLLHVEFSLVINDFIVSDSFRKHLEDFLIPLTFLKLLLDSVEQVFKGLDFIVALIFVSQVLSFNSFVFFLFLQRLSGGIFNQLF